MEGKKRMRLWEGWEEIKKEKIFTIVLIVVILAEVLVDVTVVFW